MMVRIVALNTSGGDQALPNELEWFINTILRLLLGNHEEGVGSVQRFWDRGSKLDPWASDPEIDQFRYSGHFLDGCRPHTLAYPEIDPHQRRAPTLAAIDGKIHFGLPSFIPSVCGRSVFHRSSTRPSTKTMVLVR